MIVTLAGASGLIGSALKDALREAGHELRVLVRRAPSAPEEHEWHPDRGKIDPALLIGADAVVNLCGLNVGDKRWNASVKRELRDSRLQPTGTLAHAIDALGDEAPGVLINASAVGYYGDTGDRSTDESGALGTGFLAELCRDWEAATRPAETAHTRVVRLRTGLVLAHGDGLLGRLEPLVKFGLGGPLGKGTQFWPWIALTDEVAAIVHLLTAEVEGPVNLCGPDPARQKDFVAELARQLHRPAVLPAPRFGLRLVLGQFADEGVLVSQRTVPARLRDSGFEFTHPTLAGALATALDK